jgi:hypothetical protein
VSKEDMWKMKKWLEITWQVNYRAKTREQDMGFWLSWFSQAQLCGLAVPLCLSSNLSFWQWPRSKQSTTTHPKSLLPNFSLQKSGSTHTSCRSLFLLYSAGVNVARSILL